MKNTYKSVEVSSPGNLHRGRCTAEPDPIECLPARIGGRSIYGGLTGTPIDSEETLAFSVLENIRPMIETVPLEQAADAYARMIQGKARFRMVLVTNQSK
jgi:alcohol dehydrogenase, propanol-preferring